MDFDELHTVLNSGSISRITLYGNCPVPAWTLLHFCKETINNCIKIGSIFNLLKLIEKFGNLVNFRIAKLSKALYSKEDEEQFIEQDTIEEHLEKYVLSESPDKFFGKVHTLHRPNIFVKFHNVWVPIYQQKFRTSIIVRKVVVESPPFAIFEGLGEIIDCLRFGERRERRAEVAFMNAQIGQAMTNIEKAANASAVLNNKNVSPGIKKYEEILLTQLLEKQYSLNLEMEIKEHHIDVLG